MFLKWHDTVFMLFGSHWILEVVTVSTFFFLEGGYCMDPAWRESLDPSTHSPRRSVIPRIQRPGSINSRTEWLGSHDKDFGGGGGGAGH